MYKLTYIQNIEVETRKKYKCIYKFFYHLSDYSFLLFNKNETELNVNCAEFYNLTSMI
jgi:hypothetical protein